MDKVLILNKIIDYYSFKNDSRFAEFLGITPQTLSNWKSRNTFDIELIYTKCVVFNAEWLLTGKGPMLKGEIVPVVSEIDNSYKELAEARLDVIDGLKFKIASLEEKLSELRYTEKEPFLYSNVAEPAPELIGKKRK